jgi:hypothetical protein
MDGAITRCKQKGLTKMAKIIPTVLLNELQLGTYNELVSKADEHGVVRDEVVASYKQNVINALIRRDVIRLFRGKHYRITATPVDLKPDHVKRAPKVVAENSSSSDTGIENGVTA